MAVVFGPEAIAPEPHAKELTPETDAVSADSGALPVALTPHMDCACAGPAATKHAKPKHNVASAQRAIASSPYLFPAD